MEKREFGLFHIGRGGRYNDRGYLSYVAAKSILDSQAYEDCFEVNRGRNGKFCSPFLVDGAGNCVMDAADYKVARETGIGRINNDYDYDTTYSTYLDNLSTEEIEAVIREKPWNLDYILNLNGLPSMGYTDNE